jgi:hypothetical protein
MKMRKNPDLISDAAGPASRGRRSLALLVGGICFMGGSLAVGIMGLASASPSGTLVNQGLPGTSPWPVHDSGPVLATQNGTWNVGVQFPATQAVTGTVGIDPSHNAVSVNNFPATQVVSGTVHVASPTAISGEIQCSVPAGTNNCQNTGSPAPFNEGDVINTMSVGCQTQVGGKVAVHFVYKNISDNFVVIQVPLTFAGTFITGDLYTGTVTGIGLHLDGLNDAYMYAYENYFASISDAAQCNLNYTGYSSS